MSASWVRTREGATALLALAAILLSLPLRFFGAAWKVPLLVAFLVGGAPLVFQLIRKALRKQFGSDLLAGISIVTALLLGEYTAGVLVILMLSGGQALEAFAMRRASSLLRALARRMPTTARVSRGGRFVETPVSELAVGELLELLPHDLCPVDGTVESGFGEMDESYLTGEPYQMPKAPGSAVLSGAVNGRSVLKIRAGKLAVDSRYQRIVQVLEEKATAEVPMRRIGDTLGAWYTPLALALAGAGWIFSGDPVRFLSVLVIATPCPLLIGIPVAILGAISNAANRGIVVKDPAALERIPKCRTIILDKTGTLTYGKPDLTAVQPLPGFDRSVVLGRVAALERYSKHPLAGAVVKAAEDEKVPIASVSSVSEEPGRGLTGLCEGTKVAVTGRAKLGAAAAMLPPQEPGLECVVLLDDMPAAVMRFRDQPRLESRGFVAHLGTRHGVTKSLILSGDRAEETRHLAQLVGIQNVEAQLSPERKLERVIEETNLAPTMYLGDGINDAPALQSASVGIALGTKSDITSEAADAVVLDQSLVKVDELVHLSERMRRIALQSALGGMALSFVGMLAALAGLITPVVGALLQEGIDVLAILNALRTAAPEFPLHDDLERYNPAEARRESDRGSSGLSLVSGS